MRGGRHVAAAARRVGALAHHLEAEQERWFLLAAGAVRRRHRVYFLSARRAVAAAALLPVVAALALRLAASARRCCHATAALLAVALGFAAAKLRTEAVRAPVLERQIGPVEVTGFVELVEPRPGQRPAPDHPGGGDREARAATTGPMRVRVRADDARAAGAAAR